MRCLLILLLIRLHLRTQLSLLPEEIPLVRSLQLSCVLKMQQTREQGLENLPTSERE
jgi:hypothetical protein